MASPAPRIGFSPGIGRRIWKYRSLPGENLPRASTVNRPEELDRLLRRVRVLMLHRQVAWEAGRIERQLAQTGGRLGENDNWIAATARIWGLRLVSRDEAFTRVPRLDVVSY